MIFRPVYLIFLMLPLFLLTACSGESEESSRYTQSTVIPAVEAVQARYGALPLVERFSGNVRSENQVPLFPEINGVIEAVYVENGDFVEKGTLLLEINDEQLKQQLIQAEAGLRINNAQLKQSEARLSELKALYNRTKELNKRDLSSDLEIEQLEAQLASAEADVELAKAQVEQAESLVEERKEALSRTKIRAPISGTLGQRNAQVGQQVSTASQLFLIGDLTRLRVEIVLTEQMLNRISIGQPAHILVQDYEGNDQIIEAKLSRISPFLNEVSRSTEAEIDVENRNGWLKPGMFVAVDINFGQSEQATLIPVSAIYTDPQSGQEGVYVASSVGSEIQPVTGDSSDKPASLTEPTSVKFRPINVIARGRMEVGVGGLNSGDWVVTIGQDLLSEGREEARIRTVSWDKVLQLQKLQREDLLKEAMNQNDRPSVTL